MKRGRYVVAAIGEVLWDLFPDGIRLGGTTANVVYHAGHLGADARLISRVGDDDLGRAALGQLRERGVDTALVSTDMNRPTGTVSVELSASGQPEYQIHERVAWDYLTANAASQALAQRVDAICFGTLAQRSAISRDCIRKLLSLTQASSIRLCDINLRQGFYSREVIEASLSLANALKVSDEELPVLRALFSLKGEVKEQIEAVAALFSLGTVAYTRGGSGSMLYHRGEWSEYAGFPTKVIDTVGAGDAFAAVLMMGLLRGWSGGEINEKGNRLASFVCGAPGAMPSYPSGLRETILG